MRVSLLAQWFPRGLIAEAQGPLKGQLLGAEGDRAPERSPDFRASPGISRVFRLAKIYNQQTRLTRSCFVCLCTRALAGGSLLRPSIALASLSASMLSFTKHSRSQAGLNLVIRVKTKYSDVSEDLFGFNGGSRMF